MAITLIRKKRDSSWVNLIFKTIKTVVEKENGEEGTRPIVIGTVYIADDELAKMSGSIPIEVTTTEEEYHTQLRIEASKRNQLITSHSTDPEWNPKDYVKNLKDED